MTPITINGVNYFTNHKRYFAREVEGQREVMKKEDWHAIVDPYLEEQKALAEQQEEIPAEQTPAEPTPEAPAEKKERKHPTADAFLADIPKDKYIFKVNNKGHIRIFKTQDDLDDGKSCYVKLNPLKDGVWVLPRKDLKAARPDIAWEEKEGWASKYAYKAADWNEVAEVLGF